MSSEDEKKIARFEEQKRRRATELADRIEFNKRRLAALDESRKTWEQRAEHSKVMRGRADRGDLSVAELHAWKAQIVAEEEEHAEFTARMEQELTAHLALMAEQDARRERELEAWKKEIGS